MGEHHWRQKGCRPRRLQLTRLPKESRARRQIFLLEVQKAQKTLAQTAPAPKTSAERAQEAIVGEQRFSVPCCSTKEWRKKSRNLKLQWHWASFLTELRSSGRSPTWLLCSRVCPTHPITPITPVTLSSHTHVTPSSIPYPVLTAICRVTTNSNLH